MLCAIVWNSMKTVGGHNSIECCLGCTSLLITVCEHRAMVMVSKSKHYFSKGSEVVLYFNLNMSECVFSQIVCLRCLCFLSRYGFCCQQIFCPSLLNKKAIYVFLLFAKIQANGVHCYGNGRFLQGMVKSN